MPLRTQTSAQPSNAPEASAGAPEAFAGAAVKVVIPGVPLSLTYALPPSLEHSGVGDEITVELGSRLATGWIVSKLTYAEAQAELASHSVPQQPQPIPQLQLFSSMPESSRAFPQLKDALATSPAFLPEQLQLFEWMGEYYGAPLADIIENALPRRAGTKEIRYVIPSPELMDQVRNDPEHLAKLCKRAPLQERILRALVDAQDPVPASVIHELGASAPDALRTLESRGALRFISDEWLTAPRPPATAPLLRELTPTQETAVARINEAVDSKEFRPFLLYGVTGSGKTEVYLRAIQHVLSQGGSALLIVPEISLTPQLLDQLESRLEMPLALLHSEVAPGARWSHWDRLRRGMLRVAVGARSSVFAPATNLRLIIVDEEHEGSYKQSDGLRYHGRDVAVMRARFAGATVVLGSATPSFESLLNVQRKRYEVIRMPERVSSRPLPTLEVVDLNKIRRREMPSENLSPALFEAIGETLSKKGQIVILYNKRGFSSYLQCVSCNQVVTCPQCSVSMTLHKRKNRLLCHYCGESHEPPTHCPQCRDDRISRKEEETAEADAYGMLKPRGAGTEKVVDEIAEHFPQARIVRMDRDTVEQKDAYRKILGSMRSGEADILVGTQMIAKGHDLPGVTLVGIIDADVGLHVPDFRSSEKIFQLITQAAGRAGRGSEPGRVLVQTREPDHPTIIATLSGRFTAFARYELDYRKSLSYPPFGRLLRIIVSSTDIHEAAYAAQLTARAVSECVGAIKSSTPSSDGDSSTGKISVLGPALASIERLRGRYRWHLLVKCGSPRTISTIAHSLSEWKQTVRGMKDFRLVVDVDPYDML